MLYDCDFSEDSRDCTQKTALRKQSARVNGIMTFAVPYATSMGQGDFP